MRATNISKIAESLEESLIQTEDSLQLKQDIKKEIDLIKNYNQRYQEEKKNLAAYNRAVQRIGVIEAIWRDHNEKDKKIQFLNGKGIDNIVKKLDAEGIKSWTDYVQSKKYKNDLDTVNSYYTRLNSLMKDSYSSIMRLRKLFTGQDIIYAVEHKQGKKTYQAYLDEDSFLELLSVDRNDWTKKGKNSLKGIDSFSGFLSYIETPAIKKKKYTIDYSKDKIYLLLSKFIDNRNNEEDKVIANHEIWEMYTAAKTFFRKNSNVTEEQFGKYLNSFLESKIIEYNHIYQRRDEKSSTLQTLTFYQGGDSIYSEKIIIQNKSTNATINISTVQKAIAYITEAFKYFPRVSKKKVKKLFSAEGLKGMPDIIFTEANDYAQKQIDQVIQLLNGKT